MAVESAFKAEIVAVAEPVAPKMDLVLDDEGVVLAEDVEELLQSLILRVLMQRGDWRFNTRMGLPWIEHPRAGPARPIYGEEMDTPNFRRIEALVMRELYREKRVKRVYKVKADWEDFNRRRIKILAQVITGDDQLIEVVTAA